MLKAHKIRLNPTPEQERYFWRACSAARLAWNWALGEYNRRKGEGLKVKNGIPNIAARKDALQACRGRDQPMTDPEIGRKYLLSVESGGKCARCLAPSPSFARPALYLGKAEDEVFHQIMHEWRLDEPLVCPFCGAIIATFFLHAVMARAAQ